MDSIKIAELPEIELASGVKARVITAGTFTVMHVRLSQGADVPEHSHFHEQVANVIEGELHLTVSGKKFPLTPGMSYILPPNIPHSAHAAKTTYVVDVFHPVREDLAKRK